MRKILAAIVTATIFITSTATAYAEIQVKIDHQPVVYDLQTGVPFVDAQNRTQVPFRATMERFGAKVSWDDQTQTAIAEKDGIRVEAPIGQAYIYKNGEKIQNDTAAVTLENRTYLPIRAVLEAFGASVDWDGIQQTVQVFSAEQGEKKLYVHIIDVGQGDSIFLDYGTFEILIDAGLKTAGKAVVEYIRPYVDGELDVVVATHPHQDHIGGMPAVLEAYQVAKLIDNGMTAQTRAYADYNLAVEAENCERISAVDMPNITIVIDDRVNFRIIEMLGVYETVNDSSLVSQLSMGDMDFLFMGDLEKSAEQNNLERFSQSELLKVAHHGASTSSCQEFLQVVKPQAAFISAGRANSYRHPHPSVLKRLNAAGIASYGTFRAGTIVITMDGTGYSVNTDWVLSEADAGAA